MVTEIHEIAEDDRNVISGKYSIHVDEEEEREVKREPPLYRPSSEGEERERSGPEGSGI